MNSKNIFLICLFGIVFLSFVSSAPLTGVSRGPIEEVIPLEFDLYLDFGGQEFFDLEDFTFLLEFNLAQGVSRDFNLDYFILNSFGKVIYSEEESLFVEGPLIFERGLNFLEIKDEIFLLGTYDFILKVSSGDFEEIFEKSFEIKKSERGVKFLQLFDLSLELEDLVFDLRDLEAKVILENFGEERTEVDLIFVIFDFFGKEVYRQKDSLFVETEEVFTETFENLDIGFGKYNLLLRVSYGQGVEEYFEQSFEYKKKVDWIPIVVLILLFVAGFYLISRKKK